MSNARISWILDAEELKSYDNVGIQKKCQSRGFAAMIFKNMLQTLLQV